MLIIGHRGAPSLSRENTLKSFKLAFANNVDGIELDVQFTQDQHLAVYHDFHTHALNHKYNTIKDLTFNELQSIDPEFIIPTLEQILPIIPKNKQLHLEIKSNCVTNNKIVSKIIKLLENHSMIERTTISSFNPFVLFAVKRLKQKIKIGILWTQCPKEPWFITHYSYYKIQPDSFHASIEYINKKMALWIKNNNMKLFCYTVNKKEELKKAQALNADGIFTDYPNILDLY